jgi:hypothetical protein
MLDEHSLEEYIVRPLRDYTSLVAGALAQEHIERSIEAAHSLLGRALPFAAEHGDFWPSNILLPANAMGIYVVDWEDFGECALPVLDAIFFCTTYALDLAWRPFAWMDTATAIRRAFVEPTWYARLVRGLLERYCDELGVERRLLPLLLEVTLARMALRHSQTMGGVQGSPGQIWNDALQAWWNRRNGGWLDDWAAG